MFKIFGSFIILFFLVGCGYRPSSTYTQKMLGKKIFVDVKISRKDPKNSVLIKDAVNEAVITRLGGKISSKKDSNSRLYISIGSVNFLPILYDKDGYVVSYKTVVSLQINYEANSGISKKFSTSGEYDFPIEADSIISDVKRFEAIKYASLDALNEFISRISVDAMIKGK